MDPSTWNYSTRNVTVQIYSHSPVNGPFPGLAGTGSNSRYGGNPDIIGLDLELSLRLPVLDPFGYLVALYVRSILVARTLLPRPGSGQHLNDRGVSSYCLRPPFSVRRLVACPGRGRAPARRYVSSEVASAVGFWPCGCAPRGLLLPWMTAGHFRARQPLVLQSWFSGCLSTRELDGMGVAPMRSMIYL